MAQDNQKKDTQELKVIQSYSIRGIVEQVNAGNIKKEDILQLLKENEAFFLLYFQ